MNVFKQECVSQMTVQMTSRSRSNYLKMLLPSWCPVRSHHWSVAHTHRTSSYSRWNFLVVYLSSQPCVCVLVSYEQVKDCLDHSALPMDGATLTEALHQRGINIRYLGTVLEFVDKTPAKAQLEHFYVSLIPHVTNTHCLSLCLVILKEIPLLYL